MNRNVGLDVSLEETKIHVLDEAGGRVWRVRRVRCGSASSNVTQYQASVSSVSGDKYLNLDANGAVLNGRNRHAAPGARAGCCD